MEEEKQFCPLCGKYKTDEALKKVPINPPPPLTEKFEVEMCYDCDRVLFNMNRILTEKVGKALAMLEKEKLIVVPKRR